MLPLVSFQPVTCKATIIADVPRPQPRISVAVFRLPEFLVLGAIRFHAARRRSPSIITDGSKHEGPWLGLAVWLQMTSK